MFLALHAAASLGHANCVKTLIENGADIDAKDRLGKTPLHAASFLGRLKISKKFITFYHQLIDHHFIINQLIVTNKTAGREKSVKILIEHGADIMAKDNKGRTPRDYARE